MKKLTIAIDGPAGAGKSTVAQIVAQRLKYTYIDTGAMYRAVAWVILERGINPNDISTVIQTAQQMKLRLSYTDNQTAVYVEGEDITQYIRTPEVTGLVSVVAQIPEVRSAMTAIQQEMGREGGVVMDGRDIGTHVLPEADIKIFLTASIEERAKRRWLELKDKGYNIEIEQLRADIHSRDEMDCSRDIAPLIQAADAILMDTTALSIEGAVQQILAVCEEKIRDLQSSESNR